MVTVNFEQMDKKGLKSLIDKFDKAALPVQEVVADNKSRRESGFSVKTATLTFESGQVLVLKVKASGDLYQAKLNSKVLAIKNYHKAETFTDEVIAYVKANEPAYAKNKAKQLARVKVAVPKVKVASTSIAEQIQTYSTSLEEIGGQKEAISSQLAALQPTIETKKATLADLTAKLDAENAASTALQKQLDDLQSGIMESAEDSTVTEAAGTAPVQLDRLQIANDMMHGDGRHPKLKAAFVEGFNNSCSMDDAIAFIDSFSDDELIALLKDEENIFEGVALKAGGKVAVMSRADFLAFIKAAEDTQILEAVDSFNAHQMQQKTPARAMILEDNGSYPDIDDAPVLNIAPDGALTSDGTLYAAHDGRGSYAINTEPTGWSTFQDTTVITPFVYQPPVTVTLGAKGNCPMCGAEMACEGDDTCVCPSCGTMTDKTGAILESAKPLKGGTVVKLKGRLKEGDELAGKEGVILESVPTVQGPYYKVKVDDIYHRGIPSGMILEANAEILAVDRSGFHDPTDPAHIDDPDHENLGGNVKPCPWCGSDVSENRCCACQRQYDMAKADRKAWEAVNKALPADDFPSQYE